MEKPYHTITKKNTQKLARFLVRNGQALLTKLGTPSIHRWPSYEALQEIGFLKSRLEVCYERKTIIRRQHWMLNATREFIVGPAV